MVREIPQARLVLSICLGLLAVQGSPLALTHSGYHNKNSPHAVDRRLTAKISNKVDGTVFHHLVATPEVYCRINWLSRELNQFVILALYAGGIARKIKGTFELEPGGFITIPPEKIQVSSPYHGQNRPRKEKEVLPDNDAELTWLSLNDFRASEARKRLALRHRTLILNRIEDVLSRNIEQQLKNGVRVAPDALDFGYDDILDGVRKSNEIVMTAKGSPPNLTVLARVRARNSGAGLKSLKIGRHAPQSDKNPGAKRDQLDWIDLDVRWSQNKSD